VIALPGADEPLPSNVQLSPLHEEVNDATGGAGPAGQRPNGAHMSLVVASAACPEQRQAEQVLGRLQQ